MKRRSPRIGQGTETAPNLTPVVNIAMVVLVVFMLSASFAAEELFLRSTVSAEGQGAVAPDDDFVPTEPLEIRVSAPDADRFIARIGGNVTSDAEELAAILTTLRQQEEAVGTPVDEIQVIIRPDGNVPQKFTIAVQEATIKAELTKVAFAASAR